MAVLVTKLPAASGSCSMWPAASTRNLRLMPVTAVPQPPHDLAHTTDIASPSLSQNATYMGILGRGHGASGVAGIPRIVLMPGDDGLRGLRGEISSTSGPAKEGRAPGGRGDLHPPGPRSAYSCLMIVSTFV
jgi:hypothetical protein